MDHADNGGSTPLMWTAENMHHAHALEILKTLIQAHASVNKTDKFGRTAFDRYIPSIPTMR